MIDISKLTFKASAFLAEWYHGRTDPVRSCELYRAEGCAHVDGPLCTVETCSMRREFREGQGDGV